MKRFFSKTLAMLMVIALIMSVAAISASAATTYTPVSGTATNMTKNLVVDANAKIPNISFNYTVSAGVARAATSSTIEILSGPVVIDAEGKVTAPVVQAATFAGTETTTAGTPTDPEDDTKKYASKAAVIDLSGVQFTKPGVYRYNITETNDELPGITYDSANMRYLDVYVTADEDNVLSINSYVLRSSASNVTLAGEYDSNPTEKSSGYTNSLTSYDLEFTKAITGNQADKNKQFAFRLVLTGANPGDYKIILADGNEGTITVGSNGLFEGTYNLSDGQGIKVVELNKGATYTISEVSQDYTPSINKNGAEASIAATDDQITGALNANVKVDFTNTRNGIIPTGVLLTVAPFAIGLLLFGAIALFLISKKRREDY